MTREGRYKQMTEQQRLQEATLRWPNGKIREISRTVDGEAHGRQQGWWEHGQVKYELNYERGALHGRH
jgi:antitoxin component YwqK of YwqJK toxin-antitoxin module